MSATLKPSNNFFAEMLLKRLAASRRGAKGTTRRGSRKVRKFARKLGTERPDGERLRAFALRPRLAAPGRAAAGRDESPFRRRDLPALAPAGGRGGNRRPSHERHRRRRPLPDQDRDPDRRQRAVRLLPRGPRPGRLLDPDELGGRRPGPRGSGQDGVADRALRDARGAPAGPSRRSRRRPAPRPWPASSRGCRRRPRSRCSSTPSRSPCRRPAESAWLPPPGRDREGCR